MHITRVTTHALAFDCERPEASADAYFTQRGTLLVAVETSEGLVGYGEAHLGLAPIVSTRTVVEQELAPLVVGEDPTRVELLWQKMFHRTQRHGRKGLVHNAIAAIDIALWDLAGQAAGVPVYKMLGPCHEDVLVYATGGFYAPGKGAAELAAECVAQEQLGFRAVKIKVGRNHDLPIMLANDRRRALLGDAQALCVSLRDDIERVRAVRSALAATTALAVDANSSWDLATALRFCAAVEDCELLWLEEPLAPTEQRASAELARSVTTPIAGYETETGIHDWLRLIAAGAIDIAQPGVTYSGGISECRRIACIADAYGLPYSPHCFSSAVGFIASLHLAAAMPNATMVECDCTYNPLMRELVEDPPTLAPDGTMRPPAAPGLGVRLAPGALERFAWDGGDRG